MNELPPSPAAAGAAIAVDAVADALDAAEFLDVDMDELAGFVALIADDLRLGHQGRQPAEPVAAQHAPDRRDRMAQPLGDKRAGEMLAAQRHDGVLLLAA